MLPVLIIVLVAVPLVVLAALTVRRSRVTGEHPPSEDDAARERTEREFEESERYQEQWRKDEREQS